jgi:hypothetical protein
MNHEIAARIVERYKDAGGNGYGDPICRQCGGSGSRRGWDGRHYARCVCVDRVEEALEVIGKRGWPTPASQENFTVQEEKE